MMTRISEAIHGWLGWCPNAQMIRTKSGSGTDTAFGSGTISARSSGSPGSDGSGKPWSWWYEHTQQGALIIWSVLAVTVLLLVSMFWFGIVWVTALVLGIMIFVLAIMSTLTVSVCEDSLRIRFGPLALIRKSWLLADIVSVTTVTNPWYYGWGIRITPRGVLYNISGFGAVEVTLLNGKTFRVGTDEPETLRKAIENARAGKCPGPGTR